MSLQFASRRIRLTLALLFILALAALWPSQSPLRAAPSLISTIYGLFRINDIAADAGLNRLVVVGSDLSNLADQRSRMSVVDAANNTLLHVPTAQTNDAKFVAVNSTTHRAYIAGWQLGCPFFLTCGQVTVYDISVTPPALVTTLPIGLDPRGIAVNEENNVIYVSANDSGAGKVLRINGADNTFLGSPYTVGTNPQGMAYNPTNDKLYVANLGSTFVSEVNTLTNTVSPIDVGATDAQYVAVNPAANRIFVTNWAAKKLHMIEGASGSVSSVTYTQNLNRIVYNATSNKLYMTQGTSDPTYALIVANGNTGVFETTHHSVNAHLLAANATANRVFVGDPEIRSVATFNPATNQFVGGVWGLIGPCGVAVNPVTNRVFVTNDDADLFNNVSRNFAMIDGTTNGFLGVPKNPGDGGKGCYVAVDPETNRFFIAGGGDTLNLLDGNTGNLLQSLDLNQNGVTRIAVDTVNNRLYTLNNKSFSVSVINSSNPNELTLLTNIAIDGTSPVGGGIGYIPITVAVNPATRRVYVLYSDKITVIDGNTNTFLTNITGIGGSASWLTVNSQTNKIYVTRADAFAGTILILDGVANTVEDSVGWSYRPDRLVIDEAANRYYVLSWDQGGQVFRVAAVSGATNIVDGDHIALEINGGEIAMNPTTKRVYITGGKNNDKMWVFSDSPALNAPEQVSPKDIVLGDLTPTYTWNAVTGATRYSLFVADLAANQAVINTDYTSAVCTAGVCSVTPTVELANATQHAWYVRAGDATAWGAYTPAMVFNPNIVPNAPTIVSPMNFVTEGTLSLTYRWSKVSGALYYAVAVYNLDTSSLQFFQVFDASLICPTGQANCSVMPSGSGTLLSNGATYGWFVIAVNYAGPGAWSAGRAFAPFITPAVPTQDSPSGVAGSTPTFVWNKVTGAVNYYVTSVQGGTTIVGQWVTAQAVCGASTCSFSPGVNHPAGTYSWYVLAQNPAGQSAYSTGQTFTVGVSVPDAVPTQEVAPSFNP